ncbi:hypothetical protein ACT17_14850 [Mycolicibacterium conceptionense]|uniref:Uncharacterized protein n=1 Tax=Mycolicibacterium conceptionense TaxID=451644 RepID=A0A0J8U7S8_9MYCO|nr:hypothetical protein [Mycolicibacterium conceptionense]KMV17573.1 hypothetical protein ACT17_14850 [Mycolicibacterium conceptionense]
MTMPQYPPYPLQQPYPVVPVPEKAQRWTAWRIADLIATLVLFAGYALVLIALLYYSLFWVMGIDACTYRECNEDKLRSAYVVHDIGGIVLFLVLAVIAVVLTVMRKPAFWLPILGVAGQGGLLFVALDLLSQVIAPN